MVMKNLITCNYEGARKVVGSTPFLVDMSSFALKPKVSDN
jgi:hypothetical protein